MSQFLVSPYQTEILVELTDQQDALSIIVNECPGLTVPEIELTQTLDIPIEHIPALVEALKNAYEYSTGEKI